MIAGPGAPSRRSAAIDACAAAILVALALVTLDVARSLSITCDEVCDVGAGVADLTHGSIELFAERPPLPRLVAGGTLLALGVREGPRAADAYVRAPGKYGPQYTYGERLIFEDNPGFSFPGAARGGDSMVVAARIPFVAFPVLLATCAFVWARRRFGPAGGLVALVLVATHPDLLGHGALAGEDAPFAALALACGMALDRLAAGAGGRWLVALGLTAGAALGTKLTAVFLLAALAAVAALAAAKRSDPLPASPAHPFGQGSTEQRLRASFIAACAAVALALVVLWGLYLGADPVASVAGAIRTLSAYRKPLEAAQDRTLDSWLYFPHAVALKTPLGTLALVALACVAPTSWTRRGTAVEEAALHAPPLTIVLAMAAFAPPFGSRYVLAAVPFLLVSCGRVVHWAGRSPVHRAIVALLLATNVAGAAREHPFHQSSTNAFAGPPALAHRSLNDTNQDMGGGLKALATWQRERGIERLHVVAFGASYHGASGSRAGLLTERLYRIPWLMQLDAYGVAGKACDVAREVS